MTDFPVIHTSGPVCLPPDKWQTLNACFSDEPLTNYTMRMDFMFLDKLCTKILINFKDKHIRIINETNDLIHRAFGILKEPTWEDFEYFLEDRCFPRTRAHLRLILDDLGLDCYDPLQIIEKTHGRMAEDFQWIQIYYPDFLYPKCNGSESEHIQAYAAKE